MNPYKHSDLVAENAFAEKRIRDLAQRIQNHEFDLEKKQRAEWSIRNMRAEINRRRQLIGDS